MPNRKLLRGIGIILLLATGLLHGEQRPQPTTRPVLGQFTDESDVGETRHPGSATFESKSQKYSIRGSGANIWGTRDAFHFVYSRIASDVVLGAEVKWPDAGGDPHRKACCMVRQSLAPDAAYVDVAVHGDGLIALQYRKAAAAATEEIRSKLKAPARVRLERKGHLFTATITTENQPPEKLGPVTVELKDSVYVGLAVSAHNIEKSERAEFSSVIFDVLPRGAD